MQIIAIDDAARSVTPIDRDQSKFPGQGIARSLGNQSGRCRCRRCRIYPAENEADQKTKADDAIICLSAVDAGDRLTIRKRRKPA